MEPQVWKLVQKRAYDLLSHRYGLLVIIGGAILITVSAFHFGEVGGPRLLAFFSLVWLDSHTFFNVITDLYTLQTLSRQTGSIISESLSRDAGSSVSQWTGSYARWR